ncbi:AzlD domain-containing protein [Tsukamurella pulmonis]|uniref:Branched-chain amino acid transport protein (AzlD) n=1 Tax=Tsukamurella pulmonis TaxID=47312 RepID=A0A1H1CLZ9_9ACTN|nr:AzlD domain-containing protein [Tsukamurella pulmonis]RDH10309.1 AzlD domain-containing protein [Tsukamurella pulmonis]SDQ65265.1 Branched-chain amino acid transport protein (AzlD) [Tsukamurella pulmonis]SUP23499.1 Branched-chain amino acid transport protein (AzlD) [Tsukamurella pulmonis]
MTAFLGAGAALAALTFVFRAVGPMLADRFTPSAATRRAIDTSALTLLAGVAATAAITSDGGFAGLARVCGVAAAGVLAWRRAPLPLVIIVAGATTAALRALEVA